MGRKRSLPPDLPNRRLTLTDGHDELGGGGRRVKRKLLHTLQRFWRDESGPTGTEYAMLLAAIILTAVAVISQFADRMTTLTASISSELDDSL